MRSITRQKKTLAITIVAILAVSVIISPQALAARRNTDGKGNPSANHRNNGASRANENRSQAQRSRSPQPRSKAQPQRQTPSRQHKSAQSQRSGSNRHNSNARSGGSKSSSANRRQSPSPSRRQSGASNARRPGGNKSHSGKAHGNRSPQQAKPKSPPKKSTAKPAQRQTQPKHRAPQERNKAGKQQKPRHAQPKNRAPTNHNKGDKSKKNTRKTQPSKHPYPPKHQGRSHVGNKPVPKPHGGKAHRGDGNHHRTKAKDVHKHFDNRDNVRHRNPPKNARNASMQRQHHRPNKGDLHRHYKGKHAKSLRISDQYNMSRRGDVARRMGHYKPRPHYKPHHGRISPFYNHNCFKHRYWGPSLFIGVHWYPRWDTWVRWTWGRPCNPYWDPRPIYCRPIYYDPAPVWVYWETPVWTPLRVVRCGTWIDLPPTPIADPRLDLELVAVRFVDAGHPDENLGPRYRVWYRNNSNRPIAQPFDVMLFAGDAQRPAADMPQAGVKVAAIDTGEIQSVDIRLPIDVYQAGRDEKGKPVPFSVLHVLVDAADEIAETNEANNGAGLAPADVMPVDPAAFELEPVAAAPRREVIVAGEGFGPQPGQVLIVVDGKELDAEILGWYDLGVRFAVPDLAVAGPIEAEVIVIRGDRTASNPLKITITPK